MNIEQAEKRVERILANADKMIWNELPLSRDDYEAIHIINSNYKAMADIIYSQQKEIEILNKLRGGNYGGL